MSKPASYSTIILGAGPAGLACAGELVQKGHEVLIIDHAQKSACKVDIAGGGKANFSNTRMVPEHFHSLNPHFSIATLKRFTPDDFIDWLARHNVQIEEREHGQLFCARSAKDLSRILRDGCKGSAILLDTKVAEASYSGLFNIRTNRGVFTAQNLVIALGSSAFPQTGASSLGLHLAKQFGHRCIPFRPALVGLTLPDWTGNQLAGLSLPVKLSVIVPENHPYRIANLSDTLPMLFTHTGISGPAVLQASLLWEDGFHLNCDFLPGHNLEVELQKKEYGKLRLQTVLRQFFPNKFAQWILATLNIPGMPDLPDVRMAELSKANRQALVHHIHNHIIIPAGTEGFMRAEAAKGGVATHDVSSKTLESKLQKGLYFCGEVLDVTGRLGGYNIHWAVASGKTVGKAISQT